MKTFIAVIIISILSIGYFTYQQGLNTANQVKNSSEYSQLVQIK